MNKGFFKFTTNQAWAISGSVVALILTGFSTPIDGGGTLSEPSVRAMQEVAAPTQTSLKGFKPAAQKTKIRMEYPVLDLILNRIVMDFGSSARTPFHMTATLGSKLSYGHSGVTALEGNRVIFSRFSPQFIKVLTEYRQDIEKLGTQTDFARLTKDQQLAYWYNLHNVAVIEQIALHYPVVNPEKILIGAQKIPLHEAKILNVKGVALSLKDIRTKIVYPNWNDPLMIYGFFLGNVGGPNIRKKAYTGLNVQEALKSNAVEFINSLRGVRRFNKKVLVAPVYREAEVLFPDWSRDVRTHLQAYAQKEVQRELANDYPLSIISGYPRVADLMGGINISAPDALRARTYGRQAGFFGATPSGSTGLYATKSFSDNITPPQVAKLLMAVEKKKNTLRLRKQRSAMFKKRIVIVGEDRNENSTDREAPGSE